MTWFALLVFVSFLAIVFTMVPRVLRVFSGIDGLGSRLG